MHHVWASGRKTAVNGVGAWRNGYVNLTCARPWQGGLPKPQPLPERE